MRTSYARLQDTDHEDTVTETVVLVGDKQTRGTECRKQTCLITVN